ncbi:MAG TPA: di-trans,poly-cis-decaprenylcistransferase [Candidatus Dependentiae bacterium]|nr:di-trans,poly-cis-decaprenylcistransferase [Candidatus Dependentiae bacterium]
MIEHLACIMDGNRRWAKKKGWMPWYGHKEGIEAAKRVIQFCIKKNIPYLSLYTFSIDNFKRPADEIKYLFNNIVKEASSIIKEFKENGVRARFIGDRSWFPESIQSTCDEIEQETVDCSTLHLNLLFCYGARQEIVNAVKTIIEEIKQGKRTDKDLTPDLFSCYLWTADMPDPDLIIRTGGVKRLSNFLLYQAAYSELYFLDCLWPDITESHLEKAVSFFYQSKRNFGT